MSERSGIIYEMGYNRYGLAISKEQVGYFTNLNNMFVHVFSDRLCTRPEQKDGKPYSTLKNISKLKPIGFSD